MGRYTLALGTVATVTVTTISTVAFTEVPLWVTLAMLGLVGAMSTSYFWIARSWLIAPATLGLFRQLRDRVRTEDIHAAAQAATLAGDPKFAHELLGRYGIELCPSCCAKIPSQRCTWSQKLPASAPDPSYARHPGDKWTFVNVCPDCHETPPVGWECARFPAGSFWSGASISPTLRRRLERAQQRVDDAGYRTFARFQTMRIDVGMSITRMGNRLERMGQRLEHRVERMLRRRGP